MTDLQRRRVTNAQRLAPAMASSGEFVIRMVNAKPPLAIRDIPTPPFGLVLFKRAPLVARARFLPRSRLNRDDTTQIKSPVAASRAGTALLQTRDRSACEPPTSAHE